MILPASFAEIQGKKKVLVSFKLGDLYTETFVYDRNHAKAGETGVSLKARLLKAALCNILATLQAV